MKFEAGADVIEGALAELLPAGRERIPRELPRA
jgi:hypothetical protein